MPANISKQSPLDKLLDGLYAVKMSDATPLLPYPASCQRAVFLRRSKRFLIEIEQNGDTFWVHSNNSGSMMGLLHPGTPVLLSCSDNPKRKLSHTLEAIWVGSGDVNKGNSGNGFWCGVNTLTPNRLLRAAFDADMLPFARRADGYESFTAEMKYQNSRFDGFICGDGSPDIWVECKNVTLCEDDMALFPDAVTERGQKHLRELIALVQRGARAVMFYVIERPDCHCFAPADLIDLEYAKLFYQARDAGVEIYPVVVRVDERGIFWDRIIPVSCLTLS